MCAIVCIDQLSKLRMGGTICYVCVMCVCVCHPGRKKGRNRT